MYAPKFNHYVVQFVFVCVSVRLSVCLSVCVFVLVSGATRMVLAFCVVHCSCLLSWFVVAELLSTPPDATLGALVVYSRCCTILFTCRRLLNIFSVSNLFYLTDKYYFNETMKATTSCRFLFLMRKMNSLFSLFWWEKPALVRQLLQEGFGKKIVLYSRKLFFLASASQDVIFGDAIFSFDISNLGVL